MHKETLEKCQIVANIFAVVAIPVLVGIFGWVIQNQMKEKEMRRDFVQIAISVLSEKSNSESNTVHLKRWAARLLAQSSPVEFESGELDAFIYNSNGIESFRRMASDTLSTDVIRKFIRAEKLRVKDRAEADEILGKLLDKVGAPE